MEMTVKTVFMLILALQIYGSGELTPIVTSDGEHKFTFFGKPDKAIKKTEGGEDAWLDRTLSILLASHRWCLDGWEITERSETSGHLFIEGRCL